MCLSIFTKLVKISEKVIYFWAKYKTLKNLVLNFFVFIKRPRNFKCSYFYTSLRILEKYENSLFGIFIYKCLL